jgi:DNA-binding MarR family transcriptional regulator
MLGNRLSDEDYQRLLAFRSALRGFLHWSDRQAVEAGLTNAQHQLLIAIRGHPDPRGPTIGDVARHLLIRHHSAVELVDRAQLAGLVERRPDATDQRVVRLGLTGFGRQRVAALSALHLEELRRLAPLLDALLAGPEDAGSDEDGSPG